MAEGRRLQFNPQSAVDPPHRQSSIRQTAGGQVGNQRGSPSAATTSAGTSRPLAVK